MQFSLMFFSSREDTTSKDKYKLVLEGAKFADEHGFSAVWVPERHFTELGCLYPNPALLHAALARETKNVGLRAGSVVMPLHNPIRVAEEWSVVDNLSAGRVGISFASGWHPNDFIFFPEKYLHRHEETFHGLETVRKLWRGEPITTQGVDGKQVEVRIYPTPIQRQLPVWITAAGNPKTFIKAGEHRANLLTHLFDQEIGEVAEKIVLYREAFAKNEFDAGSGKVSMMLHTFIGEELDVVREQVRGPYCEYLKTFSGLLQSLAQSRGQKIDISTLSSEEVNEVVGFVFERFFSSRALLGTPESCLGLVKQLKAIGVDEIACLLDFGMSDELILRNLPYLKRLKDICQSEVEDNRTFIKIVDSDSLEAIQVRCAEKISGSDFYERLSKYGVQYGSSFQAVEHIHRRPGEALGRVRVPDLLKSEVKDYGIHPAFLDAFFQVLIATLPAEALSNTNGSFYMPTGLQRVRLYQHPGDVVWSHAVLRNGTNRVSNSFEGDVRILNEEGQLLMEVSGLKLQRLEAFEPSIAVDQLSEMIYELDWQPSVPRKATASLPELRAKWVIFTDKTGVGRRLAMMLQKCGEPCVLVRRGKCFRKVNDALYHINPSSPDDFHQLLLNAFEQGSQHIHGIIHLWSLDAAPPETTNLSSLKTEQKLGCNSVLHVLQSQAALKTTTKPRLWLVSRETQRIAAAEMALPVPSQAPLWGLGRTIGVEHPDLFGGIIDLSVESRPEEAAAQVFAEIHNPDEENQTAYRQGQRYVPRLIRKRPSKDRQPPLTWKEDGSYLITGGRGVLGLSVARWMVAQGAKRIVLLSRTKLPPRSCWNEVEGESRVAQQIAVVRELESKGASVELAATDVTSQVQMVSLLNRLRRKNWLPIHGVVHLAGSLHDGPLLQLDAASLYEVMRPKVAGGWLLHDLFKETPLDFFVLFSSAATLWPIPGQGSYAAAHAFLDALAYYRQAMGLPALCLNWGAWADSGTMSTLGGRQLSRYLTARKIRNISHQEGLEVLEQLLQQEITQALIIPVDWPQLRSLDPIAARSPMLAELVRDKNGTFNPAENGEAKATLKRELFLTASPEERRQLLETQLRAEVAKLLGLPASKLDIAQPLTNIGFDSLMAIQLKNRIELELGIRVPVVKFLQGLSLDQIITELIEKKSEDEEALSEVEMTKQLVAEQSKQPVTDVGQLSDEEVDSMLADLLAE